MHVLVFEPVHGGHCLAHVGHILPALASVADRVTFVTTPTAAASEEFRAHVAPLPDRVLVEPSIPDRPPPHPTVGGLRSALKGRRELMAAIEGRKVAVRRLIRSVLRGRPRELKIAIRRHKPDHVIVPTGDILLEVAGLLPHRMKCAVGGIEAALHTGKFAYESAGLGQSLRGRALLLGMRRSPFHPIHLNDPIAFNWIQANAPDLAPRVRLIPESVEPVPAIDKMDARRALGIEPDGRVIGCTGSQSEHKGVDLLVRAFAKASLGPDDRLLLAGTQTAGVRQAVADALTVVPSRQIVQIDRFLSKEEFKLAIAAMDVVAVPHPRHNGLSTILIKGVAAGRPVLASNFGWLGYVTRTLGLGWTCSVDNADAFAASIRTALDMSSGYRVGEPGRRLVAYNSVGGFRAAWKAGLRARLGLPPEQGYKSWEWVLEAVTSQNNTPR